MLNLDLFAQDGYLAFGNTLPNDMAAQTPLFPPKTNRQTGALALWESDPDFGFAPGRRRFGACVFFPEPCPLIVLRHMLTTA